MNTPSALIHPGSDSVAPVRKRRGIQLGQVIRAGAPEELDKNLKLAAGRAFALAKEELAEKLPEGWSVIHVSGLKEKEIVGMVGQRSSGLIPADLRLVGCQPDGGIFILVNPVGAWIPFLMAEAKHQGWGGNAIERWFKNYALANLMGIDMAQMTFCTGAGSRVPDGVISRTLNVALAVYAVARQRPIRSWNERYVTGPSMFAQEGGFELDALVQILRSAIVDGAFFFSRN